MRAVVSVDTVVVGIDVLGTADGAFGLLAGGVLGAAANVGAAFGTSYAMICAERFGTECQSWWNSSGSHQHVVVD